MRLQFTHDFNTPAEFLLLQMPEIFLSVRVSATLGHVCVGRNGRTKTMELRIYDFSVFAFKLFKAEVTSFFKLSGRERVKVITL